MQDLVYECEIVVIIFESIIAKLRSSSLPALEKSCPGKLPHLFIYFLHTLQDLSDFKRSLVSCEVYSVLLYCILFFKIALLASVFQIVEGL